MGQEPEQPVSGRVLTQVIFIGLITILVAAITLLSAVPPVSRDALTHHLAVPRLYLKHGGIYEIPTLIFSYYPMNLDLLYIIPLYFGNDIMAKFIHFAFALLSAWLIFGYLKKRSGPFYALVGVIFFLSLPIIVKLSITAYVDLGLVFFSTAALVLLFKWIESSFEIRYLIISAICCGLALGTKYNGLILLFLLTLCVAFVYARKTGSTVDPKKGEDGQRKYTALVKATGYAAAYLLIALVIFSPWPIRNYIWTNNPIYPLYDNWFNPEGTDSSIQRTCEVQNLAQAAANYANQFSSPFVTRKVIYQESIWQILLIPIRIFIEGKDDNPKYFDGRLNPYLLLLPFFAFFPKIKDNGNLRTEKKVLLGYCVLFLLVVYFQRDLRIRYIAPAIPPLVILSTLGLRNLIQTLRINNLRSAVKILAGGVVIGIVSLSCMNAVYIWQQFQRVEPISYLSGRIGRDAYIEKYRPEYGAFQYANQHLPVDAKIFCLFLGNRSYYSEREMFFGENVFRHAVWGANSAEEILEELTAENYTHLLIRFDLFNDWCISQFDEYQKNILGQFFKEHTRMLFAKGGYGLYRLAS